MSRKRSAGTKRSGVVLMAALLVGSGCGGSKKPIVVGSKDTAEQMLIGELVAQHLEHRLGRKIVRNLGLGNTAAVYQALLNGEVGVYPEETGTIQANILKENPSVDAATTLERVRNEMRRLAQAELLDPLGFDHSWAIVVSNQNQFETLSDAQAAKDGWKMGATRDFNERRDGMAMLNQYRLPMGAVPFVGDLNSLYDGFDAGRLTMVVGTQTDGWLGRHENYKTLRDDKRVFGYYQTCLMARSDVLATDPKIQSALGELSGKITTKDMRRLNAAVAIEHKKPADVAAEFLTQAGLK